MSWTLSSVTVESPDDVSAAFIEADKYNTQTLERAVQVQEAASAAEAIIRSGAVGLDGPWTIHASGHVHVTNTALDMVSVGVYRVAAEPKPEDDGVTVDATGGAVASSIDAL